MSSIACEETKMKKDEQKLKKKKEHTKTQYMVDCNHTLSSICFFFFSSLRKLLAIF